MTAFIENEWLETWRCGGCGLLQAVAQSALEGRRKNGKGFHCFNGCERIFRKTEADQLREDLARQKEITEAERARANRVERERDRTAKAHQRMRTRVFNGVCPCCNRSFQNLRQHMQDQHGTEVNLRVIREAFGLTQNDVADEVGVQAAYVSLYERGKHVPAWAVTQITAWMERQAPKAHEGTPHA